MPWRDPKTVPFSRIGIVAEIPSESGVYAIFENGGCLLVGESWNLKARLLELANVLTSEDGLLVTFELCDESACPDRKATLTAELMQPHSAKLTPHLPGLALREPLSQ